jgi:hypothetical protein
MKLLYWNLRGIANTPTRLALQRLLLLHKPDLLFIAEPWMDFGDFPPSWFRRLGFKLFSFNDRGNLKPNLWCLCTFDLNPSIIDRDDQQVTFSLPVNSKLLFFSAIYASIRNLKRKDLWNKLNMLQASHNVP